MAVKITYFVHGTTEDNKKHLATGQADIPLAEVGVEQGKLLGEQRPDNFDVVFSSDLKRAYDSAVLAFEGRCEIIQDKRLRECHYGDLTQKPKDWDIMTYIDQPYPHGESYKDVEARIRDFLSFLKQNYDGKHVAIMAHQAPQLAIEVITMGKTWQQAIGDDWRKRKAWQPGWEYTFK
ncbi:histidine phosphatase family protein [Candidatus Woesearchaeota archaeon]|nr:histidine phosphatase family protein [Candidatus Woesearchaeota archaeon]MBW3022382.1 histidine phosphatase family protein [Candidatus Woesearchaeota archaeon]